MSRALSIAVYVFTALFFAVFLFLPMGVTVKEAFNDNGHFTLDFLQWVFRDRLYLEGFLNALLIAVLSTGLSFLIAFPLAYCADRYVFPGKELLSSLLLVPLMLPPFVGAIGVKQILGPDGALNVALSKIGLMSLDAPVDWLGEGRLWGIVIMIALHLYPIVFLNLNAALANLDPAMEEAAANLGANRWKRLWRITIPLTMPGIFAGGAIVFVWSFTELGVPLVFDFNRVTAVQIFDGIKDLGDNPIPYVLAVVMLLFSTVVFAGSKLVLGRSDFSGQTSRAVIGRQAIRLRPWQGALCVVLFLCVIFLALIPHLGVILISIAGDWYQTILPETFTLQHYRDALGHELTVPSIANSLKYASAAMLCCVVLGLGIAYVVERTKLPGRHALDAVAMLPLAVPGLVIAFGYMAMTQPGEFMDFLVYPDLARESASQTPVTDPGFLGGLWNSLKGIFGFLLGGLIRDGDPVLLLVIAYTVRRLPYVVRSAAAGFQQTSVTLEEAAQNLGASPLTALRKITAPLIMANLIAGGLLAFSFAMLEVSDSLILAEQRDHYPITKAIYALLGTLGNGQFLASALGVWAMVFLAVTLIGAGRILGKKLGALFRY